MGAEEEEVFGIAGVANIAEKEEGGRDLGEGKEVAIGQGGWEMAAKADVRSGGFKVEVGEELEGECWGNGGKGGVGESCRVGAGEVKDDWSCSR